jgi:hypothetical protein
LPGKLLVSNLLDRARMRMCVCVMRDALRDA